MTQNDSVWKKQKVPAQFTEHNIIKKRKPNINTIYDLDFTLTNT